MNRPDVTSEGQKELDKAEVQFKEFEQQCKDITHDVAVRVPIKETENALQIAQKDIEKAGDTYLKPVKSINNQQKFNEKFRKDWEEAKIYVNFIAENKEVIGDVIEIWTRPFGGVPAEFWNVPSNKPVWGPRYLADQIKSRRYTRLVMNNTPTQNTGQGQFYGQMVAESRIQRLDAHPVSSHKSFFMGR